MNNEKIGNNFLQFGLAVRIRPTITCHELLPCGICKIQDRADTLDDIDEVDEGDEKFVSLLKLNEMVQKGELPVSGKKISQMTIKEEFNDDTAAMLLPDIHLTIARDRQFRQALKNYLQNVLNDKKHKLTKHFMEGIGLINNNWTGIQLINK